MAGKGFAHASNAEAQFQEQAQSKGWTVLRGGWPDFAIVANDVLRMVEVKSANDLLSDSQVELFEALEKRGIQVMVWWELTPSRLMHWKRFLRLTQRLRKCARQPGTYRGH